MADLRFAPESPLPNKRAFVHPVRRDGRHPVTFVYPVSGAQLKKLIPHDKLEESTKGYDIINVR